MALAQTTHSVAATGPVAIRLPISPVVHYNSSSEKVRLSTSATIHNDKLQPDNGRNLVPTATYAEAAATVAATERAMTITSVTATAAGGKGPPGITPDGPTNDSEEDKMAKSAFYRNSQFTRRTFPNGWKPEPIVMDKLPLEAFNGDVRHYHQFRDDFVHLI